MLIASLALGVPLAPLIGVWVAMTNLIPQIGGLLGAVPFVLLGLTQGAGTGVACLAIFLVYQNIENHVIQPVIVGRAVKLSPPATMVAALVGVSAGGCGRRAVRGADPRRDEGDLPRVPRASEAPPDGRPRPAPR